MKATVLTLIGCIIAIWAIGMYNINTSDAPIQSVAPSHMSKPQAEAAVVELEKVKTLYLEQKDKELMPLLKRGAVMVLTSGKCKSLFNASRSTNEPDKADPRFYYQCDADNVNGGQFYLTASQIKAGVWELMPPIGEQLAYSRCEEFAKKRLNFPSTYDRNLFSRSTRTFEDGRRFVSFDFQAKNAFGMKLPASVECKFFPDHQKKSYEMEATVITQD